MVFYEIWGLGDVFNFNIVVLVFYIWDMGYIVFDLDEELKVIVKLRKGVYGSGWNVVIMVVEVFKVIEMIGSFVLCV